MDYVNESGEFTEDFRESLPDLLGDDYYNDPETRQQPTKELDNIKTLGDMAKRVVNGSRKISAHGEEMNKATEGMIKIPGEGATEEDIAAYRTAQGVPDSPDGYALTVPGEPGYDVISAEVKNAAHEAGISPSKLSFVWDKIVTSLVAQTQAIEKKGMDLLAADVQALKDAKKEKYDSFISDTDKVAAHFDIKEDATKGTKDNLIGSNFMKLMEVAGYKDVPAVREFLGAIAPLVLEGKTVTGAGSLGGAGDGEGGFSYQYDEHGKPV